MMGRFVLFSVLMQLSVSIDTTKFISGALISLSAMIALELPHITLLTKM
jgi:Conserved hypothetical ATP binding protein